MVALTTLLFMMLNAAVVLVLGDEKVWKKTRHTLSDYNVAGVNLAIYGMEEAKNKHVTDAEPYELFEEFNCLKMDPLNGDETWSGMQQWFRHPAEGRSLSFYNDKVALKRWLPSVGFDIPEPFVLRYASELTSTGEVEDEKKAILQLLPKDADYVAKPSHQFLSRGVWVVSHDTTSGTTRISRNATERLRRKQDFDPMEIANDLAEHLHGYGEDLSRAAVSTQAIEPGIVVEERFTAYDRDDEPALEFKVLTIWGRVHVANWRRGGWKSLWWPGVVNRNGTMVEGSEVLSLPDWVDWSRVVDIAERLGAHKDMFRIDMFVGVAAGSPALREEASESERQKAVRYVVSEISHISSEPFPNEVMEESLRLWIAGYKIGNYRIIPNTEVPLEFQDHDREKRSEL